MFRRFTVRRFACLLGLGLGAAACDDVSVSPVGVASIDITPRQVELAVGTMIQLTATARSADGSAVAGTPMEWQSSDPTLAVVDGSGRVTGLGPGAVAITASGGGAVGSAAVRVDLPAQVSLSSPDVALEAVEGAADPAPVSVGIRNVGGVSLTDLQTQVTYQAGASGWLDAVLGATTAPTDVTLTARISGLRAGTYGARVRISSSTSTAAQDLVVTLLVLPPGPAIVLGADSVALQGVPTASNTVTITNGGVGTLTGLSARTIYPANAPTGWLSARVGGGTAPTTVRLVGNAATLAPGTYEAEVEVASSLAGVSAKRLRVTYAVVAQPPTLSVSPASVALSASQGQAGSPVATVSVTNTGNGVLDGLGTAVSYASGQPSGWLTATLSSTTAPATLTLTGGVSGLAVGQYDASVEVRGSASNSPRFVAVTLTVGPAGSSPPAAPSGLSAAATSGTAIALNWADNATTETSQPVERSTNGGATWSVISTAQANQTSYSDTGLTPGSTYLYRVRACNAVGCSAYSNTASATTPAPGGPPATPSGLAAVASSATDVALSWMDNATTETSQPIERSSNGGSTWTVAFTAAADQTSYTDTGLTAGTTYLYRVQACSGVGCSGYSNTATVTTPAPVGIPAPPTGLSVTPVSGTTASLTWTDQSNNETGFEVEHREAGGSWSQLATLPAGTQAAQVSGLTAGLLQEFRVRACNQAGCSAWTPVASVVMPPAAPSGLTATSVTATQVDLAWTDNSSNEVSFVVLRGTSPAPTTQIATLPPNTTTWSDPNVASGTLYYYRVAACSPAWCIVSNEISVQVP